MRIYILIEKVKNKLHIMTMKPNRKKVDKYYQKIFRLWQQVKTPERESIKNFNITLKLSVLHAMFS